MRVHVNRMRLFVGGLEHSITEDELKQRFQPFGNVSSVQRVAKNDEAGLAAAKVFAYINIDITDVNLKKCMAVYNKSKWKGCQLKIQPAKEDFLVRLKGEREAKEMKGSVNGAGATNQGKTEGDGKPTAADASLDIYVTTTLASNEREKKLLSNKKRLEALKVKANAGAAILPAASQHIIFGSSDEEDEHPNTPKVDVKTLKASTISKKLLFDDDDKPPVMETRYEGESGHKLFSMQQQIGHDTRFQVSEKFLDGVDEKALHQYTDQTDSSTQLQREKLQALNILSSMFGDASARSYNQELAPPVGLYSHYDPLVPGHTVLEQHSPHKHSKAEAALIPSVSPCQPNELAPIVQQAEMSQNSLKRFYTVTPNLTSLFGSGEAGQATFNFLQTEGNDDIIEEPSEQPIQNVVKPPTKSLQKQGQLVELNVTSQTISNASFYLFFHSNTPKMSNRLSENSFYRGAVLDEIEQKWKAKKPKLKECCRQRWKDAIKRTKRFRSSRPQH